MIEILCFGDSNTYGFTPDWKHRYGRDIRYPGVLQTLLGDGYYVAEDGLIGRTAAFPDSNRDGRSALDTLPLSIEEPWPGAVHRAHARHERLQGGQDPLCRGGRHRHGQAHPARHRHAARVDKDPARVPAPLGASAPQRDPEFDAQSLTVSQGVAEQYRMIAEAYGLRFLDAGTLTQMSALDGEHLDPDGHKKLAAAIAGIIRSDCEA